MIFYWDKKIVNIRNLCIFKKKIWLYVILLFINYIIIVLLLSEVMLLKYIFLIVEMIVLIL